jgi:hypothetical protein
MSTTQKTFLEIPYSHIIFAKENKLLWSPEQKKWTISSDHINYESICHKYKRINLKVPFEDKDLVKENNARWCFELKTWYTYQDNKALYDYMIK